MKLFLIVFYIAHFFSCTWYYIGLIDISNKNSWLNVKELNNESWEMKYVSSLYFSIVTMVTVGYGDISPTTLKEKNFCN